MSQLLQADRLVFRQKAKLVEMTNEYQISDEEGAPTGFIRQEGQSTLKKIARFAGGLDQFMTHKLSVYDGNGAKVLEMTRPRKVFKSRVLVSDGKGTPVGDIVQENVFGHIRFDLRDSGGRRVGQIRAENWVAWDFSIVDTSEQEVARITKKWVGLAKAVFTTADNYLMEIDPEVEGTLRLLVLASAAGIDTALKQDDRGFSLTELTDLP